MTTPTEREALLTKELRYIEGISTGQVKRVAAQALAACADMLEAIEAPEPKGYITVEAAIVQLVESLCYSKGWTHAYANARVRDAVDPMKEGAK